MVGHGLLTPIPYSFFMPQGPDCQSRGSEKPLAAALSLVHKTILPLGGMLKIGTGWS
jgi:hypothetical protein